MTRRHLQFLALAVLHAATALRIAVTGAAGYLGAEIACMATSQGHSVRAVVKEGQCTAHLAECAEIRRVDDLCDLAVARDIADGVDAVIHAASVFRKCDDMELDLVTPNIALAEAMVCACAAFDTRLVLTSSMAAVRGTGQAPLSGDAYTAADWNTVSARDGPGFEPYQYSKAESERVAWDLAKQFGVQMVSVCPSMIFGPPRDGCAGFSVAMVQAWLDGKSPVQSRLVVDVRDVAQAHIAAATAKHAAGKRYICSTEARVPATECADALRSRLIALGREEEASRITADEDFDGGAIPIGAQEVVADAGMAELGVACRSTAQTLSDMAEALATAVDARDAQGETALIRAAEAGDTARVRELLAEGASATAASFTGWTAMHGAAECGSAEVVGVLAAAGGDVSARAASGKTPLDISRQYEQPEAAARLAELGAAANVSG